MLAFAWTKMKHEEDFTKEILETSPRRCIAAASSLLSQTFPSAARGRRQNARISQALTLPG